MEPVFIAGLREVVDVAGGYGKGGLDVLTDLLPADRLPGTSSMRAAPKRIG